MRKIWNKKDADKNLISILITQGNKLVDWYELINEEKLIWKWKKVIGTKDIKVVL